MSSNVQRKVNRDTAKFSKQFTDNGVLVALASIFGERLYQGDGTDKEEKAFADIAKVQLYNTEGFLKGFGQLVDANMDMVQRKKDNLKAKMREHAAVASLTFAGEVPDMKPIKLTEEAGAIFMKPILVTVDHFHWMWHFNAWPFPGVSMLVLVLESNLLVHCASISDLRELRMESLVALNSFMQSQDDSPTALGAVRSKGQTILAAQGGVLFLPHGCIPLVTAVPAEQDAVGLKKTSLLCFPLLHDKMQPKALPAGMREVNEYLIKLFAEMSATKTWPPYKDAMLGYTDAWKK